MLYLPDFVKLINVTKHPLYFISGQIHTEVHQRFDIHPQTEVPDTAVNESYIYVLLKDLCLFCAYHFEEILLYLLVKFSQILWAVFMYLSSWYESTSTF